MLQVAFDASEQPTLILDADNKVRWGNQAAADAWTNGLPILLPRKAFADLVQLATPEGHPISENERVHPLSRMKMADGDDRYLLIQPGQASGASEAHRVRWRRVTEVPGGFVLFTFANLDPAEQALLQQQRLINQLAHELRTPLAIVNGCLKRLSRSTASEAQEHTQITTAHQETRRIDRLLEQLSLLSQLDVGSYRPFLETRSLGSFLEGWSRQLRQKARHRVSFNLDDLNPALQLKLDQLAFNRILNHLLENSLRFCPAESPILITAHARDDQLEILFMDWGPGIPESDLANIFDRFRRLETLRSVSHTDGAGLGLAVVQALTQAMDGSVCILPNRGADGMNRPGTVVQLILPVHTPEPSTGSSGNHKLDAAHPCHRDEAGLDRPEASGKTK